MIISPPFLPVSGVTPSDASRPDPMMDLVDQFEIGHHGVYPVTFDRRFHCGIHLNPGTHGPGQAEPVRAIADGEVVAYRVCKNAISDGATDPQTGQPLLNSNAGFVLLRHKTDTGDGRAITYYSLYMHLLDMTGQENMAPQPNDPPETGTPNALPRWLLDTAGGKDGVAQPGGTKKVYRKDMLGYVGKHQDVQHLHFEVFMADADFTAWFDQAGHKVQIGEKDPAQPQSGDYWGHSYFIIKGPLDLSPKPAGMSDTWFPRLPGGSIGANDTLYVEAWFNKGRRYTRAWIDRGNSGNVVLLTPDPVADPYDNGTKHYEYDLYQRAMALYPACPSDGYEMLRFGRILSRTHQGEAPATWIAVPFDESGKQGYVNIAPDAVKKLSDADFPFFTGWQKVDEENTPFNHDGLCGYDSLCRLTGVEDPQATSGIVQPLEYDKNNDNSHNQQLAGYIQIARGVREKLRGLVCMARSEWDPSNNDDRYKNLNDPDGFFGRQKDTNPDGYRKFIDFLGKFQFLDKTPLAGQKLWFFHPLAFIRHFRRCGWLTVSELAATFPRYPFYTQSGSPRRAIATDNDTYRVTHQIACQRVKKHVIQLNKCIRKYIGSDSKRIGLFLAQVLLETAQWRDLGGAKRLMHEWGFGHYSAANPATQYYGPFYGRGIMQLTWAGNFDAYGKYRAIPDNNGGSYVERLPSVVHRITTISRHYTANPADGGHLMLWFPRYDPDIIAEDAEYACDSGGFYWVSKRYSRGGNINRVSDDNFLALNVGLISRLVNGGGNGYYERQAYSMFALRVLDDGVDTSESVMIALPHPKNPILANLLKPE
ncbi:hypothetical protein L5014_00760 [Paraburkholderia sp. RG36]|uniref:Chitinase n=2 Tax=Paraburkholderia tagetis TaxID=2913261 RepID=A0A9X1RNE7_9BURK|nr:hypothetical protein [Paraburkholderia tagetis]